MTEFKSGFISIIGSPNVGKSTLLNALVKKKIAIVSDKAQTTRNRISGVLNGPTAQIVLIDTPGVQQPRNRLGQNMLKTAYESLRDVEAILLVLDSKVGIRDRDEALLDKLGKSGVPVVAALNKSDIVSPGRIEELTARLEGLSFIHRVCALSAKTGEGVDELAELLFSFAVNGPQYFPADMLTDQPEKLLCQELIREQALNLLKEEVPHGILCEILKLETREEGGIIDIYADIWCERDSHKGIVIGKGGQMLKRIGEQARMEIERLLGGHVNLQLWVKVREGWRNSPSAMKLLGYE